MSVGVIGQGTGVGGIGVVGITNTGNVPAMVAWNTSSTGDGDGLDAQVSGTGWGAAVHAQSLASTGTAQAIQGKVQSPSATVASFINYGGGPIMDGMIPDPAAPDTNNIQVFRFAPDAINLQATSIYLNGDVHVNGNLSKNSGSFRIDHPLDPENKYLYHSFVESPDMMNVYNGNAVLDAKGEAIVTLPKWFDALNRDFRYQLTSIGAFMPIYVAQEITKNQFKIAGGKPGGKVSWQVTGIRQDKWANEHRIPVEEDKPASERGKVQ
jgi:hypothetical protein